MTDELEERRERNFGEMPMFLGPKGQARWAELEEQARQRPGEPDDRYKARRILEEAAAGIRLGQGLIIHGYMRPEVDMGIPMPGTGCPANVRPGVRCGGKPADAAGLTLCANHLAQAVAAEEDHEDLVKVKELISKLDALDSPPEREISRARIWARELGYSLSMSRAGRPVPRFWLYNSDRTRLLAGGTQGMTYSGLLMLLKLPHTAVDAPRRPAAVKAGAKAGRPAETPEEAAVARAKHARLRASRLASSRR